MRYVICWLFILMPGISSAIETPDYAILDDLGDSVEIRNYSSFTMVRVSRSDLGAGSDNQFFRPLAGYIFGDNSRNEKIAMTAPVAQTMVSGEAQDMAFFLPRSLVDPPEPDNSDVALLSGEMTVAALRYKGGWSTRKFERARAQLEEKLASQQAWRIVGNAIWARYNSPFSVPAFRTNEVLIPVERVPET